MLDKQLKFIFDQKIKRNNQTQFNLPLYIQNLHLIIFYRYYMNKKIFVVLILLGITLGVNSFKFSFTPSSNPQQLKQTCNITHFEFQSHVSLGKNDELNRTFGQLNQKINSLNNVTWKVNGSVTYTIYEANPTFYYRDSKQKAEIVGNDTIFIDGGYAEVEIKFKWAKTGAETKYGTASVKGLSSEVIFAKNVTIDGNFFRYELYDYINVTYDDPMSLTRVDPPLNPEQQSDLLKLVNNVPNVTTLRHQLEDDIALYYPFYLKMNLHEENAPIEKNFFYHWVNPVKSKGDLVVNFTRRPVFIDLERDGIHYGYEATIDGYTDSKCGPAPPSLPLDPRTYGGSQQFISYTFYENLIRYAIKMKQFDTTLNKDNWESRMFQFYAGDLYELFPQVASTFIASTEVTGACQMANTDVRLYKAASDTFNVSLHSNCQLQIRGIKIIEFAVGLELEVEGRPNSDTVDYYLKSHTEFISYYDNFGYKLYNKQLADAMIKHSLNRLYSQALFGSGWPLHPQRDYPHFMTEAACTVVYDSTHV